MERSRMPGYVGGMSQCYHGGSEHCRLILSLRGHFCKCQPLPASPDCWVSLSLSLFFFFGCVACEILVPNQGLNLGSQQ